jgi:hypothetical protein
MEKKTESVLWCLILAIRIPTSGWNDWICVYWEGQSLSRRNQKALPNSWYMKLIHCSAFGETPRKALSELLKAKDAWLESARANRKPIPKPHYSPIIYQIGWLLSACHYRTNSNWPYRCGFVQAKYLHGYLSLHCRNPQSLVIREELFGFPLS